MPRRPVDATAAPASAPASAPAPAADGPPPQQPIEEIEEIDEELLGEEDDVVPDLADPEDDDEYSGDDDDFFDMAQLAQLLVTEEGEPVADVLRGIRDALDKHNKILYKLATAVEKLSPN